MTTFAVSDVEISDRRAELLDPDEVVPSMLQKTVEAFEVAGDDRLVVCDTNNAFAKAAHDAFYGHHPLRIRPDDIWFCIAQGFAHHVNKHTEALRERFVSHEGKETIVVERGDFRLGRDNPWPEAFDEFAFGIGEHVGKLKDLVCADFSTSGPVERAAFAVTAMDTFQGYFEYVMMCGCGIPQIELLGTPKDWASIITRTRHLSEYGLEAWTDVLIPVLEKIAKTAQGDVDVDFWRSLFRYQSGSGPAELTGWILTLFPYIENHEKELEWNRYLMRWAERYERASTRAGTPHYQRLEGPWLGALPQSLCSAPVKYVQLPEHETWALRFVAGHLGVTQDDDGTMAPAFGWAVVYDEDEPIKRK